jgi:hypothetical protein
MRFWVICLFVVLLPWRLWAADAMTLQMLELPDSPAQHQPCHGTDHGLAHHAAALGTTHHAHTAVHPSGDPTDHNSHGMCLLCDVCHNTLGLSPQAHAPHFQAAHHPHTVLTERVASALRQPGFKPPIG